MSDNYLRTSDAFSLKSMSDNHSVESSKLLEFALVIVIMQYLYR